MRWTARLAKALSRDLGIAVSEDQVRIALAKTMEERLAKDPQGALSPAALIARSAGLATNAVVEGWVRGGSLEGYLTSQGKGIPDLLSALPSAAQTAAESYVTDLFTHPVPSGPTLPGAGPMAQFAGNLAATLREPKATPRAIEDAMRRFAIRGRSVPKLHPHRDLGVSRGLRHGELRSLVRSAGPAGPWAHPHATGILPLVALDLGMSPESLLDRLKDGGTIASVAGPQAAAAERLLATQLQGLAEVRTVHVLGMHRSDGQSHIRSERARHGAPGA